MRENEKIVALIGSGTVYFNRGKDRRKQEGGFAGRQPEKDYSCVPTIDLREKRGSRFRGKGGGEKKREENRGNIPTRKSREKTTPSSPEKREIFRWFRMGAEVRGPGGKKKKKKDPERGHAAHSEESDISYSTAWEKKKRQPYSYPTERGGCSDSDGRRIERSKMEEAPPISAGETVGDSAGQRHP